MYFSYILSFYLIKSKIRKKDQIEKKSADAINFVKNKLCLVRKIPTANGFRQLKRLTID